MGFYILHFLKIKTPCKFAYVYLHEKHNEIKINIHKLIFGVSYWSLSA